MYCLLLRKPNSRIAIPGTFQPLGRYATVCWAHKITIFSLDHLWSLQLWCLTLLLEFDHHHFQVISEFTLPSFFRIIFLFLLLCCVTFCYHSASLMLFKKSKIEIEKLQLGIKSTLSSHKQLLPCSEVRALRKQTRCCMCSESVSQWSAEAVNSSGKEISRKPEAAFLSQWIHEGREQTYNSLWVMKPTQFPWMLGNRSAFVSSSALLSGVHIQRQKWRLAFAFA